MKMGKIMLEDYIILCIENKKVRIIYDKFPYGKPQTDEVARGSGTESMAVRD